MYKYHHYFLLLLLLKISGVLLAQKDSSRISSNFTDNMTTPDKLYQLISNTGGSGSDLLHNTIVRHKIIKRMDELINEKYYLWTDHQIFKTYLEDTSANQGFATRNIEWKKFRDSLFFAHWDILFTFLQLDSNVYDQSIIEANISCLENHPTIQYLCYLYIDQINQEKYNHVANSIKTRNYQIIQKHLAFIEEERFVYYKSSNAHPKVIKEIDWYMDNDIFIPGNFNKDRDYTGGGVISVSTDYLDWKWLNPGWIRNIGKEDKYIPRQIMLSYQSFSFGLKSFTPYIRYRNNFELADTLFQHDRPFGSYIYIDRSNYRLWPKGLVRSHSALQIGAIGTNGGKAMQGAMHKVYGWEKQVANGGRWLVQINNSLDLLLFSTTNKYRSIFCPNSKNSANRNFGLNIAGTGEVLWGGYLTAMGGGLKLSSSDFVKQSGQGTIKPFKNNEYKFGIKLDASIRYRYIIHNSLLEGYGYWTTFIDEIMDDESGSVYTLNQAYYELQNQQLLGNERRYKRTPKNMDELERHVFLFDFGFNLKFRQLSVYWYFNLYSKEYKGTEIDYNSLAYLVRPEHQDFFSEVIVPALESYRDQRFYGYVTIGATWLFENKKFW